MVSQWLGHLFISMNICQAFVMMETSRLEQKKPDPCRRNGWTDRQMDGWMNGWMDGRVGRWVGG
jgi:hypothetical protein